jgi:hypothetical protein
MQPRIALTSRTIVPPVLDQVVCHQQAGEAPGLRRVAARQEAVSRGVHIHATEVAQDPLAVVVDVVVREDDARRGRGVRRPYAATDVPSVRPRTCLPKVYQTLRCGLL